MVNTRRIAGVLVILAFIAGIGFLLTLGGGPGTNPGTSTPTPDTTTSTPTPTPTPSRTTFPTAVTADGITNASALLQAHSRTLQNADSYTISYALQTKGFVQGREIQYNQSEIQTYYNSFGDANRQHDIWETDAATYHYKSLDTQNTTLTHYYLRERTPPKQMYFTGGFGGIPRLPGLLRGANFTHSETITLQDGTQAYKFTATGIESQSALQRTFGAKVVQLNATLVITETNVIHKLNASAVVVVNQQNSVRHFNYSATQVGTTTPQQPSWLSTAKQEVVRFDGSVSNNIVKLTHTNGDSILKGSRVVAVVDNTRYTGILPFTIDKGETFYIYLQGDSIKFSKTRPTDVRPNTIPGLYIQFRAQNGLFIADLIVNE